MNTRQQVRRNDGEDFRQLLDRNAIWNRMVAPGDRLPLHPLVEVHLGPIHLDRLLHTGPLVLLFFRHAGSPACETALRDYRATLAPALDDLDAHLVAVSPQAPDRLAALQQRLDLGFLVAADPRHTLIDALNIGFPSPGADRVLGTGRSVLPYAATIVTDRSGTVRLAEIQPDWSTPTDPGRIINAVAASSPPRPVGRR
jgi:peroxiredoxin